MIQSGGKYDVRFSAQSDKEVLKHDVILLTVGCRYNLYCSKICRTIFVDASDTQKSNYLSVVSAYEALLKKVKPGVKFSELYDTVKSSLPDHLKSTMSSSVGHSIGIEVKESMTLNAKSNNAVRDGMVLHLRIALSDIENKDKDEENDDLDKYAILLGDTVIVKSDVDERTGNYCRQVTKFKHDWSNVAYDMNDGGSSSGEEEGEDDDVDTKNLSKEDAEALREAKKITGGRPSTRLRSRTSKRNTEESNVKAELRRAEKQRELMMKRMKALQNMDVTDKYDDSIDDKQKAYKERISYPSTSKYPRDIKNISVCVDEDNEVVFLPINSVPVPFHISTIKSVSKDQGDRAVFLRINFYTPAKTIQAKSRNADAIENVVAAKFPEAVFIKEISIRSTNQTHLNKQVRLIKEMQKRIRQKKREKKEMENVVKQAAIKLVRCCCCCCRRWSRFFLRTHTHIHSSRYETHRNYKICP